MDCVFCRIIAGNLPALKVYEDERTLVIMDIARDADGHMLVIPKSTCKTCSTAIRKRSPRSWRRCRRSRGTASIAADMTA